MVYLVFRPLCKMCYNLILLLSSIQLSSRIKKNIHFIIMCNKRQTSNHICSSNLHSSTQTWIILRTLRLLQKVWRKHVHVQGKAITSESVSSLHILKAWKYGNEKVPTSSMSSSSSPMSSNWISSSSPGPKVSVSLILAVG